MHDAHMSPQQFSKWMAVMHLGVSDAANLLGLSRGAVRRYADGDAKVPRYVALACAAVRLHVDIAAAYR